MNPIDSNCNPDSCISAARHHVIRMAIAALLITFLYAQAHSPSPELSPPFSVAAVISRPLPFEAKLAPGTFLVASRRLRDSSFAKTVILLIAYDENGAQGVVINRPSPIPVSRVLPELPKSKRPSAYVYLGGPVAPTQMRMLVQTDEPSGDMKRVLKNVYLSGNPDVLKQLMNQSTSALRFRAFAGYAGWAPGQLEQEIERGSWHIFAAEVDALFDPSPESVWPRLVRKRDLKRM